MLREIAARLGVQVDESGINGFMSSLDKAKGGLQTLGKALAFGAFGMFVRDQIDAADDLGDTADRLGTTTDELQRFQYAVKLTGGSAETANKAVFLLNKQIGEAAGGSAGAVQAFADLGMSVKDSNGQVGTAIDFLPTIAEAVKNAGSQAEKTALATKIFGKSAVEILPLLDRGAAGVSALNQEFTDLGLGLSDDFVKGAGEANDSLDRATYVSKALTSQLLAGLMPVLNRALAFVVKLGAGFNRLAKHTTVIKTATFALSILLAGKLIPSIVSGVRAFMALRTVMMGASLPFWLVAAAIAALYLIFDDLYAMMTGGESVIGTLLDKMGGVGTQKKAVDLLKGAWQSVKDVWDGLKKTFGELWSDMLAFAKDPSTVEAIIKIGDAIESAAKSAKKLVDNLAAGIYDAINGNAVERLDAAAGVDQANRTADKIKAIAAGVQAPARVTSGGGAVPPPAAATNVQATANANVTINNYTGKPVDPKQVTGAIDDSKRSAWDTYRAVATGGK